MIKKLLSKYKIFLFLILISSILLISFNIKTIHIFSNKVTKLELKDDIEQDNWEISTVFYDSTVNDGKTPLTEINWDASDGGYGTGESRKITIQINYKNTNTLRNYSKEELILTIKNLKYYGKQVDITPNISANDSTHNGYDWTLYGDIKSDNYLVLKNEVPIDISTNFEGSIRIDYIIVPEKEVSRRSYYEDYDAIEKYDDECFVEFDYTGVANLKSNKLNSSIDSNEINFHYERKYNHPWNYKKAEHNKEANKLNGYDLLGEDATSYYWVKYKYWGISIYNPIVFTIESYYPDIGGTLYIKESFCKECIVLNKNYNRMTPSDLETNTYTITTDEIIVGYPKSIYNLENNNLNITSSSRLYMNYEDGTLNVFQNECKKNINLSQYDLNLNNLYSVTKNIQNSSNNKTYYESLVGTNTNLGNKGHLSVYINPRIKYFGEKIDIKVGDDILFITNENGNYGKLTSEEYYFSSIYFPTYITNGNSVKIPLKKYEIDLYVKHGDGNYTRYDTFLNGEKYVWDFSEEDNITGFYFYIKNLEEGIETLSISSGITINKAKNIPENGKIVNFAFMEPYYNDTLREHTDNYNFGIEELNSYLETTDVDIYGHMLERDYSTVDYTKYDVADVTRTYNGINKYSSEYIQDENLQKFIGETTLIIYGDTYTTEDVSIYEINNYAHLYKDKYKYDGWNIYDLLPLGMKLESTEDEIIESLYVKEYAYSQDSTKKPMFFSSEGQFIDKATFLSMAKDRVSVEIKENFRNTGRTYLKIKIDFSDYPLIYAYADGNSSSREMEFLGFKYKNSISYDSFTMYGNKWTNRAYVDHVNGENKKLSLQGLDNGLPFYGGNSSDIVEADINNNGSIEDKVSKGESSITIPSIISTHQDVQTSIQTDQSNYDIGMVNTSNNSEYIYKLRVRTGTNDVTNLVIYDSLEDYAKNPDLELVKAAGTRNYWQGEFLGIDTTYAESKGYTIKTYYSEEIKPGNLSSDNSWHEYNDNVDKSKVKSLAFKYLDSEGNPAIIPANSLTYVLIKMKSPSEDLKTLAYNGCWTEWNAIDPITNQPVDFITGINSNIVRVALPNSFVSEPANYIIEKVWNDNNNILNIRPDIIKIKIIPDGDLSRAMEVTLTNSDVNLLNSNMWTKTIELDKYDENNNLINYTYQEEDIELNDYIYHSNVDNNIVTNNLSQKYTLTKKWIDNNNEYLTRPSSTTIKIYQNNNYYQDITITGDYSNNIWNKEIYLPAIDSEGNKYNYTFEEVSINKYETTYDINTYTFTNILKEDKTINIKKKWFDNNNLYNTRPTKLKVYLKQNNNIFKTITLEGTSNEWVSEDIIIPIYDNNGIKYNYSIEEDDINEDYTIIEYDQTNFEVSNTLKKNIILTITKNWKDGSNSYNTRPDNLKINLLQNNNQYQEITLSGDSDTWTYSIEVPKYDNNQVLYKYTIEEDLDNTEYKISYDENGTTVTNTLDGTTSIEITKVWIDEDNKYNTRPDKILVNILRNNEIYKEVELSKDEWKTTIDNLPIYDDNGYKYTYTIEEKEALERYTKVTYNQEEYIITNELTDIPKVTLYFTLKNGYSLLDNKEILYDEEGLNKVLSSYNLDNTYKHKLTIKNIDTNKIYTGEINTLGILEFKDIPYGTYESIEEEDEYFNFVSMLEINKVDGIEYTSSSNGGRFTIKPTGKNIIYGINIINKISYKIDNPNTKGSIFIISLISLISIIGIIILKKIRIKKFI